MFSRRLAMCPPRRVPVDQTVRIGDRWWVGSIYTSPRLEERLFVFNILEWSCLCNVWTALPFSLPCFIAVTCWLHPLLDLIHFLPFCPLTNHQPLLSDCIGWGVAAPVCSLTRLLSLPCDGKKYRHLPIERENTPLGWFYPLNEFPSSGSMEERVWVRSTLRDFSPPQFKLLPCFVFSSPPSLCRPFRTFQKLLPASRSFYSRLRIMSVMGNVEGSF